MHLEHLLVTMHLKVARKARSLAEHQVTDVEMWKCRESTAKAQGCLATVTALGLGAKGQLRAPGPSPAE